MTTTLERFSCKYAVTDDGCWEWVAYKNHLGYSKFWDGKRVGTGHRWSYEHHVGPIPKGLTIDHLCRNRACVNPDHLEAVTQAENNRRAGAAQTHCKQGHPFNSENTTYRPDGYRRCRTCHKKSKRKKDVTA